jgi:hypothetical protein
MNLIPSFLRNLFKPKSAFVPEAPARVNTTAKQRNPKRVKHHWLWTQLNEYTGEGRAIITAPAHVPLATAQSMVSAYLGRRYGYGKFTTRQFKSARTIHINPL